MFSDIPRHVLNNIMKFLICVACAVSLSWRKCETPHCLTCCRSSTLRSWTLITTPRGVLFLNPRDHGVAGPARNMSENNKFDFVHDLLVKFIKILDFRDTLKLQEFGTPSVCTVNAGRKWNSESAGGQSAPPTQATLHQPDADAMTMETFDWMDLRRAQLAPMLIVFARLIWHTCTALAELLACCTCMVLAKLFGRQSVAWDCLCGSSRCPSDGPGAKPRVCHPCTHYSGCQPCGDVTGMGSLCTTQNAVPNAKKPRKRQPRVARGRARAKVAKEDVTIVILKTIVSKTARTRPCSPRHRGCPPTHRLVRARGCPPKHRLGRDPGGCLKPKHRLGRDPGGCLKGTDPRTGDWD